MRHRREALPNLILNGLARWKPYERHLAPLVAELAKAGLLEDGLPHEG